MNFRRGDYVFWTSNSGVGVGKVADIDALHWRLLVHPDGVGFPFWISMNTRGLRPLPELDLRSDYA